MNFFSSPKQNLLVCSVLPYCITLYDKYFHSVSLFIYQVLPLSASLRQGPDLSGVHVKLLQPCPTLCDPMGCSHRLLWPWDSPGKNSGVGGHALLQGIFPT